MRFPAALPALLLALPAYAAEPAAPAGAAAAEVAAFSRHARYVSAAISPGGTYLAAIATEGGRRTLVFVKLGERQVAFSLRPDRDDGVATFHWVSDERVVVEVAASEGHLARPVRRGEILAINADGSGAKMVYGHRAGESQTGSHIRKGERDLGSGWVIDTLRGDDRRVLIGAVSWQEAGDRTARIYKLDALTGVKTPVTQSPAPWAQLLTDERGEPRLAWGRTEDLKPRLYYRDADAPWRDLSTLKGLTPASRPAGFSARDRALHVVEPGSPGFRLDAVNVETGERKAVARNDLVPPEEILVDGASGRIFAVEFQPDLPTWEFPEPDHPLSRLLKGLLAAFPDDHVQLLNWTRDGKKAAVRVFSDRNPGAFLVADVEKMTVEPVLQVRPWIRPEAMAEMTAFHIKASDGLWIHGYLTLPRQPRLGSPPPLVVLPHGGPHGVREVWGFDAEAQLLASRGFAVLQVNYRGSGGYGTAFEQAGYRNWGKRVIEDILDATRWAIQKKQVDGGRVCTYGASFGAYAAMQAAILAPDLVRCAAGYAGLYDLSRMASDEDFAWSGLARGYVRTAVGDDPAALRAASPAFNAEKIRAKVLLVHGGEDTRTPIGHAEALREALTRAGNPPAWMVEPKEGHGFYDEAARERMYRRLLAFLEENLAAGGKASGGAQ